MKNALKKILPRPVYEKFKRYALYGCADAVDSLLGRRDPLVPPRRMIFIGGGAFKEIGDEFLGHFKTLGRLRPTDHVLDIGSGIGRMARPLTQYLTSGRYEGIDIDRAGVEWSNRNIAARHPNFRFQVADIFNKHYNPGGRYKASEYKLPFADGAFDFVFLTSVFTHMFPEDVANYLREIGRVLKPGGRCLITYFLWTDEVRGLIEQGKSRYPFFPMGRDFYVVDKDVPEDATCFDEGFVRNLYPASGLQIEEPIHFGSWCGRGKFLSAQDIIVAVKR